MKPHDGLPWSSLLELHAVNTLGKVIQRRWRIGLGYVDARSGDARPPRLGRVAGMPEPRGLCQAIQEHEAGHRACESTARAILGHLQARLDAGKLSTRSFTIRCHAGPTELVAPIMYEGECFGGLLCGGWLPAEAPAALQDAPDGGPHTGESAGPGAAGMSAWIAEHVTAQGLALFEHVPAPRLAPNELELVAELLEAAAEEIALVYGEELRKRRLKNDLTSAPSVRYSYDAIIGKSPPMQELYSLLDRVVQSNTTVLVQGENGTGKELVARAIHNGSARKNRRFMVTNCSAFNDNLLDSELFGHRRGAFTGAVADKPGLFELADEGTFFLDEIGDMSPSLQVKVLRVLQEGTFILVGDTETRKVDVRIIAATNRDLGAMVAAGEFREDLYYRINVINLHIPPLRERREDIELLVEHFLHKHTKSSRSKPKTLTRACMERFMTYDWPGNVRELENEIERLVVLASDERVIDVPLLSPRIREHVPASNSAPASARSLPQAVHELEQRMIVDALERNDWNKTHAAAELEISRRNLIRLVQRYGLEPKRGA